MESRQELIDELGEELCEYCPYTNGDVPKPYPEMLCEGRWCEDALDHYIDANEGELTDEPN